MYNGIGLTTARGSGTSGYVQKNLSTINRSHKKHDYPSEQDIQKMEAALNKPPNQELLTHQKKRQIELKCLEERERLESQGYDEDAIERRLLEYREELKIKAEEIAKVKEPTISKLDLFKSASWKPRGRYSPSRNHRANSKERVTPEPESLKPARDEPQSVTCEPQSVIEEPQPPKTDSLPKYTIKPSKIVRRSSSSDSPSPPPRHRRRSPSPEKKSKKSRRHSPKSRRSTSRTRRSTSKSRRDTSQEKKYKSKRESARSRRHRSTSKTRKSRSKSTRSESSESESASSRSLSRERVRSRSSSPASTSRRRRSRSNSRSRKSRRVSPNFRESRRITSARKRPTPYQRYTSSEESERDEESDNHRYSPLNGKSSSKHWPGKYSPDSSVDSM